jgi:ankyrin repeat protein
MDNITPYSLVEGAIKSRDTGLARELLARHVDELKQRGRLNDLLRYAARRDNLEMVKVLVEFGADIHAPEAENLPDGVIYRAAGDGAVNVVRWLLQQGVQINFPWPDHSGENYCSSLIVASFQGHLEVVKLLVEQGGADINALSGRGYTPLSYAIMYGKRDVEAYLRSKGALETEQLQDKKPAPAADVILAHIERHLGKPNPLALQEIVAGDPPITIHAVPMKDRLALVTTGMSARPMTVPPGGEEYRYAELLIYLPKEWPLTQETLADPNYFWPIDWLRRIARYPHEHHTWLGGPFAIIANEEPPQPLAPNTRLTCLLALPEAREFSTLSLADGRRLVFYTLIPLYTEERDLEKAKGIEELLTLFQSRKVSMIVDINRPNVAPPSARRPSKRRS